MPLGFFGGLAYKFPSAAKRSKNIYAKSLKAAMPFRISSSFATFLNLGFSHRPLVYLLVSSFFYMRLLH